MQVFALYLCKCILDAGTTRHDLEPLSKKLENLEKIANVLKVKIKDLFDFEHQKDDIDLYSEIINRTKSVNRERLQDFYKIILSLTE